jgi:hypothetical protein
MVSVCVIGGGIAEFAMSPLLTISYLPCTCRK